MGDSVTLRLDGTVSVSSFASAAGKFARVLDELAKEEHAVGRVDWVISDLAYGSAILTASPVPQSSADEELVPKLVSSFIEAAREVRTHPTALNRPVLRLVSDIARGITDSSHEVAFETADAEVTFTESSVSNATESRQSQPAFGTIRGRVQTLQQRQGLRFIVYDLVYDKAVTCYVDEQQQELLRNVWGQLVEVTGMVTRDPLTDRPRTIRRVADVRVVEEGERLGFLRARGAVHPVPGSPPSEVLVRRVRDAV